MRRSLLGLLILSVLLYLVSLSQDAFYIDRPDDHAAWSPGLVLLLTGWLAVFDGQIAWLANPCLLFAWVFVMIRPLRWTALVCALASTAFALSFLLYRDILANEAGHRADITGYAIGYGLWVASCVVMVVAGIIAVQQPQSRDEIVTAEIASK